MLLAYDDFGPGPVVVLLHGFPLNRSMWSGQRTNLGTTYRVIAPDLRGHGDSATPPGPYTMDLMADDVVELLDVLQIGEPIVLGGLSMGGYVAQALLARHPERVRALILMDTRAEADSIEAAARREQTAKEVEAAHSVEPVVQGFLPKVLSSYTQTERSELVERVRGMMARAPVQGTAAALRGMAARPDRTAFLATIQVPTLVLVGEEDALTPPAVAQTMAQAIPNVQYVVIPHAGHLAPLENPDAVNAAILRFLGSLS